MSQPLVHSRDALAKLCLLVMFVLRPVAQLSVTAKTICVTASFSVKTRDLLQNILSPENVSFRAVGRR